MTSTANRALRRATRSVGLGSEPNGPGQALRQPLSCRTRMGICGQGWTELLATRWMQVDYEMPREVSGCTSKPSAFCSGEEPLSKLAHAHAHAHMHAYTHA
jgi:hypothetical protein